MLVLPEIDYPECKRTRLVFNRLSILFHSPNFWLTQKEGTSPRAVMVHANIQHRRTHNLLLISKLLSQQTQTSPFTLVLDTLEQPAKPLIREYLRRAKLVKDVTTIFLAFETFGEVKGVDYIVHCQDIGEGLDWQRIARDVGDVLKRSGGKSMFHTASFYSSYYELTFDSLGFLIIIDSLTTLSSLSRDLTSQLNLTAFLSSLLQPPFVQGRTSDQDQDLPPQISLVAVHHTDVPLPSPCCGCSSSNLQDGLPNAYAPPPLSLLSYLATTIITVHSLAILLAEKSAEAKSLAAPAFGLSAEIEGQVIGLKPVSFTRLKVEERGMVLELEHRRKSGRGVREWFFLPTSAAKTAAGASQAFRETVILLDDHPLFRKPKEEGVAPDEELSGMTFELGLTERQRLEREGVVLPYFDAQKAGGGGGGGRILYDMGAEDDFDEEEDEI